MSATKLTNWDENEMAFELGLLNAISKCKDEYLLNRPHEIAREKKSVSEDRRRNDIKRQRIIQQLDFQRNAIEKEQAKRWRAGESRQILARIAGALLKQAKELH